MYAVIRIGGKQYKVFEGDLIRVEKIEEEIGKEMEINEVLMIANGERVEVGRPFLPQAKVIGEIVEKDRAKKIIVFKFRRRKGYRKKIGHRQYYIALRIKKILDEANQQVENIP